MSSQTFLVMTLAAICLSGSAMATGAMWRRFNPRAWTARLVSATKQVPALLRRRLMAAEIWAQDHLIMLTVMVFTVLGTTLTLVLTYWNDQAVALAKTYQPVFTIVSIVVGSVTSAVVWLRKRKKARLSSRTDLS
ncbi:MULTISPECIES: hypothetical protein [Streptomyces]|uniref:Integral membrane protein n=2 Tax=Streptomyces TaxID=1883 RepID=A0ABU4KEV9_9ACTN|nr:hypothetical protein [Streptomyces roseolus]MDX2295892.1 hypothetical protein [Streptomyces roseolus]